MMLETYLLLAIILIFFLVFFQGKFDILFDVFVPSLYAHAIYLRNLLTLSNVPSSDTTCESRKKQTKRMKKRKSHKFKKPGSVASKASIFECIKVGLGFLS